jgi:hypothetical protein
MPPELLVFAIWAHTCPNGLSMAGSWSTRTRPLGPDPLDGVEKD